MVRPVDTRNTSQLRLASNGGLTKVTTSRGPAGANGSNVLPTDEAVAERIQDPESATAAALSAAIAAQLGQAYYGVIESAPVDFPTFSKTFNVKRLGTQTFAWDYDYTGDRPAAGVTYHVAPGKVGSESGVDFANATTPGNAINKSDVGTIVVHGGEYWHDEGFGQITKSINIIACSDCTIRPVMTGCFDPADLTWTNTSGSVYRADVGGGGLTVHAVYDKRESRATDWNDAPVYTKVANQAAVNAAGKWAQVGTTLYVWALGNANLATASSWLRVSRNNAFSGVPIAADDIRVYVEGVTFEGCGWVAANCPAVGTYGNRLNCRLITKNVTIRYAVAAGTYTSGAELTIHDGLRVSSCRADGIGYQSSGGVTNYFVEIDCESHHHLSDDTSESTVNASTSHDECIGIRLNTVGYATQGPIFADVSGTLVWNLGCNAKRGAITPFSPTNDVGFQTFDGSTGWFDGCYASGFDQGFSANNADVYTHGLRFGDNANDTYEIGSGSFLPY